MLSQGLSCGTNTTTDRTRESPSFHMFRLYVRLHMWALPWCEWTLEAVPKTRLILLHILNYQLIKPYEENNNRERVYFCNFYAMFLWILATCFLKASRVGHMWVQILHCKPPELTCFDSICVLTFVVFLELKGHCKQYQTPPSSLCIWVPIRSSRPEMTLDRKVQVNWSHYTLIPMSSKVVHCECISGGTDRITWGAHETTTIYMLGLNVVLYIWTFLRCEVTMHAMPQASIWGFLHVPNYHLIQS